MQSLRITARLTDGRIATTDLCLPADGILAYAWVRRNRPELLEATQSGIRELIHLPLPLKRIEADRGWWWAASFAFGEPVLEQRNYWHKRFDDKYADAIDFGGRRGKVEVNKGPYKAYRMPLTVILVPQLTWYVVGDAAEIRDLLGTMTHIGKKTAQGYGHVAEWTVTAAEEDLSGARTIPDPDGDELWGIRPPYWEPRNQVRVRWPQDPRLAANWLRR